MHSPPDDGVADKLEIAGKYPSTLKKRATRGHNLGAEYPTFLQTNSEKPDIYTGSTCGFAFSERGTQMVLEELSANGCGAEFISVIAKRGN
jgi:hypothetical protein